MKQTDMCLQLDHRLVVGCTVAQLALNGANLTTVGALMWPDCKSCHTTLLLTLIKANKQTQ